ncbi:CynX/NimT family MFS transporter [Pseudonocardia ailaonensis]|uniref:CynX/NimT family MFS transporter n=1 Tax=Pseudonocardia ailaonensis TaxID=367279 RepID=A0ABN2MN13_9PSEU
MHDVPQRRLSRWWLGAGIVLVAANLRPAVVAVSPVLEQVRAAESLSATAAGVLTALPVFCFGAFAPLAPRLSLRIGAERTLIAALGVLLLGFGLRLVPGLVPLFLGTVVCGSAIAVGNVLLPALIKRDFADRAGLMTGLYTMAISAGGALAAGLTVPIAEAAGFDWRGAVGMWVVFAAIPALVWAPRAFGPQVRTAGARMPGGLWRVPLAWQVTGFMCLQSLTYYASLSWLPAIFAGRGTDPTSAGLLLALASACGIVSSLVTPMLATRTRTQRVPVIAATAVTVLGVLGVLALPGAELPSMILMGIGQGSSLSLALTVIVLRAPDGLRASQLSGMAQSVGYCLAALGPFLFGALHDLSGGWTVPLLALLVVFAPQLLCGLLAARDRLVGPPL